MMWYNELGGRVGSGYLSVVSGRESDERKEGGNLYHSCIMIPSKHPSLLHRTGEAPWG